MATVAVQTALKKQVAKTPTIGSLADQMWALKQKKKVADKVVKDIESEITALTTSIFEMLDSQDTRKGEGKSCSISINSSVQATTVDWIEFMKFVQAGKRTDKGAYLHLVQRRVSVEAYRELLALGTDVKGIEPITVRTLSVTALSK